MFGWMKPTRPAQARIPDGQIVYAVGDLHGTAGLTITMIERLMRDAKRFADKRARIIFLGDYVDKGDHSKDVIDILIEASSDSQIDWTFLKGNHEDALLSFIANPLFGPQWLAYGGGPTLQSYGLTLPANRTDPEGWQALAAQFVEALPPHHLDFFRALTTSYQLGGYFFAHAGVRPGRPLDQQEDGDLMWIRRPFLDDKRYLPAIIVHGHSPDLAPHRDQRRIGIDTGAYATGRLSAVRLVASNIEIMTVERAARPAPPATASQAAET
jgi:serine/threonine protein phosphatase 1